MYAVHVKSMGIQIHYLILGSDDGGVGAVTVVLYARHDATTPVSTRTSQMFASISCGGLRSPGGQSQNSPNLLIPLPSAGSSCMNRGSQKLSVKSANVSLLSLLRRLLAICCCRKTMVFRIERGQGVESNMHIDEWHTMVWLLLQLTIITLENNAYPRYILAAHNSRYLPVCCAILICFW